MSYMEMKVVQADGKVVEHKECGNSWGGSARIWTTIFNTYLKDPNVEYDNWMMNEGAKLWPAYKDEKIPEFARIALFSTFDGIVIEPDRLADFADILDKFVDAFPCSGIDHLPAIATELRSLANGDTLGVCFYWNSVVDDPWKCWDDENPDEDCVPYDVNKGDKHQFMFKEFRKEMEAKTSG